MWSAPTSFRESLTASFPRPFAHALRRYRSMPTAMCTRCISPRILEKDSPTMSACQTYHLLAATKLFSTVLLHIPPRTQRLQPQKLRLSHLTCKQADTGFRFPPCNGPEVCYSCGRQSTDTSAASNYHATMHLPSRMNRLFLFAADIPAQPQASLNRNPGIVRHAENTSVTTDLFFPHHLISGEMGGVFCIWLVVCCCLGPGLLSSSDFERVLHKGRMRVICNCSEQGSSQSEAQCSPASGGSQTQAFL